MAPTATLKDPSSLSLMLQPPHVHERDPCAVHAESEPDASPDVGSVRRLLPCDILAPVPTDGPASLGHTFFDPTGENDRELVELDLRSTFAFTEVGNNVELIARLLPSFGA